MMFSFLFQVVVTSWVLYYASRLALHLGRTDRARSLAQEALALTERTENHADISNVQAMLGSIALATGLQEEATTHFTESYTAAKRAGEAGAMGLALLNLGEIARKRGEVARATAFLEKALALVRANEMTWGIAFLQRTSNC